MLKLNRLVLFFGAFLTKGSFLENRDNSIIFKFQVNDPMAMMSIYDNLPPPPPPEGPPPPNQPRLELKVNENVNESFVYFHYDRDQHDMYVSEFPTLGERNSGDPVQSDTENVRAYKLTQAFYQKPLLTRSHSSGGKPSPRLPVNTFGMQPNRDHSQQINSLPAQPLQIQQILADNHNSTAGLLVQNT